MTTTDEPVTAEPEAEDPRGADGGGDAPATSRRPRDDLNGWRWAVVLTALLVGALLVGTSGRNGTRALETHEMFVAQTAREMMAADEWIVPSFNWTPRLVKPPLMYWAVMGLSEATGREVSPGLARLPSALSGVALTGIAVWLGAIVYRRRTGLIAGALTAGALGFHTYANNARPEMLYAACGALAALGLAGSWLSEDRSPRQLRWAVLAWVGIGLATLAKGIHIPALLVLGVIVHALLAKEWRRLAPVLRPGLGLSLLIAIATPWIIGVLLSEPDAWRTWVEQVFAGPAESHERPLLKWLAPYYLVAFPGLLLPGAVLLPMGAAVAFQRGRADLARGRVLFWMIVAVIAIMSLQYHRRDYYLLPLIPATAVLMARGTEDLLTQALAGRTGRAVLRAIAGVIGLCGVTAAMLPMLGHGGGVSVAAAALAGFVVVCLALAAAVRVGSGPRAASAVVCLLALAPVAAFALLGGHEDMWRKRPEREWAFVREVAERVGEAEPVYVYRCDASELVYALNQPVRTLETPGPPPEEQGRWWVVLPEAEWRDTADDWPAHELVSDIVDQRTQDAVRIVLLFEGGATQTD